MWGLNKRNKKKSKKIFLIICFGALIGSLGLGALDVQSTAAAGPIPPGNRIGPPPRGARMAPPSKTRHMPPPPRSYRHYHHYGYWGNGWGDPFWGIGIFQPVVVRTRTVVAMPSMSMAERENYYRDNVLALVKNAGLWGTIDRQGNLLMAPAYKHLIPVGQGAFYAGSKDYELTKVDKYGHAMSVNKTTAITDMATTNSASKVTTNPGEIVGLKTNTETVKLVEDIPTNPVMWTKGKNGYQLINSQGQVIHPNTPKIDASAYKNVNEAKKAQEKADLASDVPVKVSAVKGFRHGVSPAKQNGKWGIVNSTGKWLVRPIYEDVELL